MATQAAGNDASASVGAALPVSLDHAYGALLGVFVGDAAGATLEFCRVKITEERARRAMQMLGGGNLMTGPGQVTDDSELTIALALALSEKTLPDQHHQVVKVNNNSTDLPLDAIASRYTEWYASLPFDVGSTCQAAFGEAWFRIANAVNNDDNYRSVPGLADVMIKTAAKRSSGSEANGALMRILPLPIWLAGKGADPVAVAEAAKHDARLSHPNLVCQECNAAYSLAVAYLITHPGDRAGAIAAVESYAADRMSSRAKHWLLRDSASPDAVSALNCTVSVGHVRYAFTLAFHFLRLGTGFEDGILQTLMKGGDTDTNAAIVGGLLGALHGQAAIPPKMKDPVLRFDCSSALRPFGHPRPKIYSTQRARELVLGLLPPQM